MQTAFLESLINRSHLVLGRRLHDFCLYDVLFLTLAQNPLWIAQRTPRLADLEEAALICSLPPERFLGMQLAPRGLIERCARPLWQLRCARRDFTSELQAWVDYVADFDARPEFWEGDDKGRRLNGPWIFSVASFVECHSNMTQREILTAPIGMILWKSAVLAERLGMNAGELMSEEEIAIGREQAEAMKAAGETAPGPDAED